MARDTGPDDRGDVRVLDPWLDDRRPDGVHDDNRVGVGVGHCRDQVIGVDPQREVVPTGDGKRQSVHKSYDIPLECN